MTTLLWGVLCVILPSCVLYKAGSLRYVISLPLWGACIRVRAPFLIGALSISHTLVFTSVCVNTLYARALSNSILQNPLSRALRGERGQNKKQLPQSRKRPVFGDQICFTIVYKAVKPYIGLYIARSEFGGWCWTRCVLFVLELLYVLLFFHFLTAASPVSTKDP